MFMQLLRCLPVGQLKAMVLLGDAHPYIDQLDIHVQIMAVAVLVFLMERLYQPLQATPVEVQRIALSDITYIGSAPDLGISQLSTKLLFRMRFQLLVNLLEHRFSAVTQTTVDGT